MTSANQTIATALGTIESDSTARNVTLTAPTPGAVLPPNMPGRQYILTNIGSNTARVGILGVTLDTSVQADGQCNLAAGESIVLERGMTGFQHKSTSGTTLRLCSGTG